MTDKPKDIQNKNDCKVNKSCSQEMMKPREGLIFGDNYNPKILPMPYVRLHETTRWLV